MTNGIVDFSRTALEKRTKPRSRAAALILLAILASAVSPLTSSAQTEGDFLYNVTMLRAAPGHFNELNVALSESFDLIQEAGDQSPFWIRHTQGDQWDFMLIYPMGDYTTFHSLDRTERRGSIWSSNRGKALLQRLNSSTSYLEEWFAHSVDVEEMARRFEGMGFFHVEIMAGLPGKREALLEQRRMENRYYEYLNRQQNVIFVRETGSNWDVMTLGLYESLQTYAAAGSLYSDAQQDEAARVAGFDGVGDIGPYLRSLMNHHHDTLGVPAQ